VKIGITDYFLPPFEIEQRVFGNEVEIVNLDWVSSGHPDYKLATDLDGLLVWHADINDNVASFLRKCRVVVRYGVGFDNIDIASLENKGIIFCNTPDYGTEEVADTACSLILGLHRKIFQYDEECRLYADGWQEHILKPISRSRNTCVGIIGLGRIGSSLALRLKTFGYQIIGYDPYIPSGHEKVLGYRRVLSLHELLSESDIISIHCPLTRETKGMVDTDFLSKMKPGSILVNTARGKIVNSLDDIEMALSTGQLYAAGLDVLPDEPPDKHCSLIQKWLTHEPWLRGRLIINPHTSYYSSISVEEMRTKASETALMVLLEKGIRNQVTSSMQNK
jgi:D-3-phosphoglycerate dehydrogenase / 2-oxoglutarate reductase